MRVTARSGLARGLVLLAAAGTLAACRGGGLTGFENPNDPPAPRDGSVLSAFFRQAFSPAEVAAALPLLTDDARYTRQQNTWSFTDSQGAPTSPFYDSFPLRNSGAAFAHATGLTGAGQTVVVVDAGFRASHEAIAGRVAATIGAVGQDSHGTSVASVVAGNSATMTGIAPGAMVALGSYATLSTLTAATTYADSVNAVAQNNSWGYVDAPVGQTSYQDILGGPAGAGYEAALRSYLSGAAGGVVVFSVSNRSGARNAGLMEALPWVLPDLEKGWIAAANAVPTMSGDTVTSVQMISAPCMEAARWCLLADGTWQAATADSDTAYGLVTGSSFAAPQVSGALALLAQAFPGLGPQDLRLRLLASAQDDFFVPDASVELAAGFTKGYSWRYGMGFLDIRAALLPIGTTSMTMADGRVVATGAARMTAGSAMGDAVTKALSGIDIAVTDSLGAGFAMPGEALVTRSAPAPLVAGLRAAAFSGDLRLRRMAAPGAASLAFDAFPGRTLAFAAPEGGAHGAILLPGAGSYGLALGHSLTAGDTRLDLGLRLASDGGQLVGLAPGAGADLAGLAFGLTQETGGGFLRLAGEAGIARIAAPAGVSRISGAGYDSLALGAGAYDVFARGDRLTLGIGMPLAMRSGTVRMTLPVAVAASAAGGPATESRSIDIGLAPEDRQIDLSLDYQVPVGQGTEILFGLRHAENFGNQAGISDTGGVLAIQISF
ncbi:MAG: S8 family serine peptidase [Rhodobacteraceae bacterium]|nr:S8 family serine peptidase [Paracoccaceae bacterium]